MTHEPSRPRTPFRYELPKCKCGREINPPRGKNGRPYVVCAWCIKPATNGHIRDRIKDRIAEAERITGDHPTGRGISTERMRV